MTKVYDQHAAAFNRVSAFVVMQGAERVATIAFKFPADGAGRLYAYVHWFGTEMVRGQASGYGYDKRSAACANAIKETAIQAATSDSELDFYQALIQDGGFTWERQLREAGFTVFQAV